MRLFIVLTFIFAFNLYARTVVLIGGGTRPTPALAQFLAHKKNGPVLVLPWGTEYPYESFAAIKNELTALSPVQVSCLCDENIETPSVQQMIKMAGAIYFPGGDQNKIMKRILKTQSLGLIQDAYESQVPIAGSSAGTAIQSNPMLTGQEAETSLGLGTIKNILVDQHFLVRSREPRLLKAFSHSPQKFALGIDENNAVVIIDERQILAIGPNDLSLYKKTDKLEIKKIILKDGQVTTITN